MAIIWLYDEGRDAMSNIRGIRVERRMTQKDLAAASGVSQPFIVDLERGARGAKPETLERIAAALGVTVPDLTAVYTAKTGDEKTA